MKVQCLRSVLAVMALAAAGTAVAQGPGPGYGPGMMGGYGPGMMGPGMMGPGMMGGGGALALDLSDEQRDRILALQEESRRKNWGAMGTLRAEQFNLQRMYNAAKMDPDALVEQQKKVDELRRQLLRARLETRNQIEALLTPEQRKQVRRFGPWWAQPEID